MIEVYRGNVEAWECDENDHMNIRYYARRMMSGLTVFAHFCGLSHAFSEKGASTLSVTDLHVRYLKEARSGSVMAAHCGVLDIGEDDVLLYMALTHENGETSAAFRMRVSHLDRITRTSFAWSPQTVKAFERHMLAVEDTEPPRSIALDIANHATITMENADAVNARQTALTSVFPEQCDALGYFNLDQFVGRQSEANVGTFMNFRKHLMQELSSAGTPCRVGGAVLESRLIVRGYPKAGDIISVRTSFKKSMGKVLNIIHWLLDPVSGRPWASIENISVHFDMDTRKAIQIPAEKLDRIDKQYPRRARALAAIPSHRYCHLLCGELH